MTTVYDSIQSGYPTMMSGFNPHLNNHMAMSSPSLPPIPAQAPSHEFSGPRSGSSQVTETSQQPRRKHSRHESTLARGSKQASTRLLLPREPVADGSQAGVSLDGSGDASGVTNGAIESPEEKPKITTVACQECQRKKCKCDGARPSCSACTRKGVTTCVYQDREDTTRKLRETNKQLKDDNQHLQDENSSLRKELEALKVRTNSMSSEHDKKETTLPIELSNNAPPRSIGTPSTTTMYNKTMEAHRRVNTYSPIRGSNDTWLPSMTEDQMMPIDPPNSRTTTAPPNLAGAAAAAVRTSGNPSAASVNSTRSTASTSRPKKRLFEECSSASDSQPRDHAQQQPSPVDAPIKPANTSKPRKRATSRDASSSGYLQPLNDQQSMQWLKGQGQASFFSQGQQQQQQQQPLQAYPFPIQQHRHGNGALFEHTASPQTIYPAPTNQELFQQYRSAHSSFSLSLPAYTHHGQPAHAHTGSATLNPSMMHQHQSQHQHQQQNHQHQQNQQPSTPVSPIPNLPHPHHGIEYKHHHRPTTSPSVSSHPSAVSLASSVGSASAQREATVPRGQQQQQSHHLPDHQHGLLNGNHGLDMNALPGAFDVDLGMGMGMNSGLGAGLGMGMGGGLGMGMRGYGEGEGGGGGFGGGQADGL